jgi:hypothetical protein
MKSALAVLIYATFMFTASESRASDVHGIYVLAQSVVFEPNETAPERIQIWGAFSFATGGGAEGAVYGYMYYRMTPATQTKAMAEWADFKSIAERDARWPLPAASTIRMPPTRMDVSDRRRRKWKIQIPIPRRKGL